MTATQKPWGLILAVGIAGAVVGGGVMFFARSPHPPGGTTAAGPAATPAPNEPALIKVSPEIAAKAGIEVGHAVAGRPSRTLRVPGHVEANLYSQVVVAANTSGRITSMTAELGQRVRRGHVLGQLFAPEIADQQRVYLSMRAELDAAHAKLLRTERLVALGSVSQQELEATRASHTTHATDVEGARARLILLGVDAERLSKLTSAEEITATADIVAPGDGVITNRFVNVGQNVETGANLIGLADLSRVWVVADVFERDLSRVQMNAPVTVMSPGATGAQWHARISYIDPQVVPETRTIRVRADVENTNDRLKLGQYVEVSIETTASVPSVMVSSQAVQTIGDRHFVYVPEGDQFREREVRLGGATDAGVEVSDGLSAGDRVVVSGSFFLRAERDRLGLPLPAPLPPAKPAASTSPQPEPARFTIAVTAKGFEPGTIEAPANQEFDLVFSRTTNETCAKAVTMPSLKVKQDLPLNTPVTVRVPARRAGTLEFVCGMNMFKGSVVVK